MLLTTVPVKTRADAEHRVEWYGRRWGIEVYHRILKSGCRVEARQLQQTRRLLNCLAIDLVVAWRIYHLTAMGEKSPDVPCTIYFTDTEWKALTTFTSKSKHLPEVPSRLNEAVQLLGKLAARAGDADVFRILERRREKVVAVADIHADLAAAGAEGTHGRRIHDPAHRVEGIMGKPSFPCLPRKARRNAPDSL